VVDDEGQEALVDEAGHRRSDQPLLVAELVVEPQKIYGGGQGAIIL
jgi:hypothetical protein